MSGKTIKVGIGFATGRKHFQRVLRSYINNWKESGLVDNENVSLNLFVAYDLNYNNTKRSDYTRVGEDIAGFVDTKHFLGSREVDEAKDFLVKFGVTTPEEASTLFGRGYAAQRNIVLYSAIRNKMDYLLYLDDDEYPQAVTNTLGTAVWGGQHVLKTHLRNIKYADITFGYHCGYVSPIPSLAFDQQLSEQDFRMFIEAISNDIVKWDTLKKLMQSGGVTYADTRVLTGREIVEVPEVNHAKFISGSNLCINLTNVNRVFPFYNPPGARGEDTFLSTCLSHRRVLRVPCYTFHDGFSIYNHLLTGVLPTSLQHIRPDSGQIVRRFYKACVGWTRYKPLLLYLTDRDSYEERIGEMIRRLEHTLPLLCRYFDTGEFLNISRELRKYAKDVAVHEREFRAVRGTWSRVMQFVATGTAEPYPIIPEDRRGKELLDDKNKCDAAAGRGGNPLPHDPVRI